MDTCFLFTKHLNDDGCFCLKLSPNGELRFPPAQCSFTDIKKLQEDSNTLIVETTTSATILDVDLPWLAERKARIAIPYALEDKLAQPIEELHFAFDKQRYQDNHYTITIIEKNRINHVTSTLEKNHIDFDGITLDWFALAPNESYINEDILLVNNTNFKGALSGELARTYLKNNELNPPLVFQDSQIILETLPTPQPDYSYSWIAQQLLQSKPLNLCQGEMQRGNTSDWIKKGYQLTGLLAGIWLISLILVNALSLHFLNKKTAVIDQQIAVIYHEFFPEAKQVISPKFRIEQLLEANTAENQNRFWFLLNQFAQVIENNTLIIEQLRYQNKTLSITVVSTDFANLEKIENNLKKLSLKVTQTQASTRDQQVVATLELM